MKKKPIKLNDEQLLLEASQLSDMYHQLTLDLFDQVIERIKARGSASLADNPYLWQANKLHEAGLLNADNIKLIAKYSGVAEAQLRHVIENEGFKIYKNTSEQLEEALGRESQVISNIQDDLSNYARQAVDDVHNLINTTLPISVIGAYQGIIQDAVAGVVTGLKTPDQAINQTVIKWFKKGFYGFTDKAGRKWRADSYARNVINTTTWRVFNEAKEAPAREFGIDTFYYSKKATAREMCAPLQHQIVTTGEAREEEGIKILALSDYGHGEPDGCLGINCKHTKTPFVVGVNSKPELPEHLKNITPAQAKANANAQAKQRAIERSIRKSKELLHVAKKLGDRDLISQYQSDVSSKRDALNYLINNNAFLHRNQAREKRYNNPYTKTQSEVEVRKEKAKLDKRRDVESAIIGVETSEGIPLKITKHLAERAVLRNIAPIDIVDSIREPLKIAPIKYDNLDRPSQKYIGKRVSTVINPIDGNIVTVYATSTRIRKKYGGNR
ncbi:TPA: phage minor capsid protein [Streptococcus pyogenes]|uniref:phage minor capsid protein n=1 Tax=Streptococcus pyogenes TaxID=1314 RepID=UPI00109CD5A1|nr:phage minor capsid protein [Streptococcus pyogenes]QHB64115.1 capsid protein [Streptococcus pyogenes]VGR14911.1 phage minor capsid 2 family protein [Streptococcus pyogenes]VHB74021.1 phage minor capsid 2 family protein [Streptococcus pyogenes]VHE62591.1 phage minor capsid 2 family protein [Streptococcus pyogenes]VHF33581.1 phage minor capsid 2 family protein [Streptococcus pyogenes]